MYAITQKETSREKLAQLLTNERVIALWILAEALLGGILHTFKVPFSGVFFGGK